MPRITELTKIIDGRVYGQVMHYTYSEPELFEICSVEEWIKMTEEEAEKEALGCFYENAMNEDKDMEDIDWWY